MNVNNYIKNNPFNIEIIEESDWQDIIFEELIKIANYIHNDDLKIVVQNILQKYKIALCVKPATSSHHFYKGGLLWHTYCVTRNAIILTGLYPKIDIDMDLIIFGSLLHDIGKTYEIADYSQEANYKMIKSNHFELITHAAEGIIIIDKELEKRNISTEFRNQILHVVGSHMNGYCDWGDVHSARMLEPVIINFADNIDSKLEPCENNAPVKAGEWFSIPWNANKFQKSFGNNNFTDLARNKYVNFL